MIDKKDCTSCGEKIRCRDNSVSWIFFIIGLIATIAVRAVTVLMHLNPVYGKVSWYVGIGGFLLFFVYKYKISSGRTKTIQGSSLIDKIHNKEALNDPERHLIKEILCSLTSRKEAVNYLMIFLFSAIALLIAFYIDFIK